ncbi:MAG: type IV pilin [Methanomicrobiales archaeon]|nr:type IV pilin [Methanomicrobiales archaeon]
MVALTIILAALVLLMVLGMIPTWSWAEPAQPPIIITGILHTSTETGELTYASRIFLLNNGSTAYKNDDLKATVYRNDQLVVTVETLNGYYLISSHHYGVRYIQGPGCCDDYWNPGEEIEVDLSDRTFSPGEKIAVKIIDKETRKVISEDATVA